MEVVLLMYVDNIVWKTVKHTKANWKTYFNAHRKWKYYISIPQKENLKENLDGLFFFYEFIWAEFDIADIFIMLIGNT
jgi:hypothetical protein